MRVYSARPYVILTMRRAIMAEFKEVMDPETGELLYAAVLDYGDRVTTESQRAGATKHFELEAFKGRNAGFTFTSMDDIHFVIERLTTAQCGYLLVLQCYVDYDGGRIIGADNKALTTAEMMDVLQLRKKRQTFYDLLSACLDSEIITKDEHDNYYVNPRYHFRGTTQNRMVVRTYTAKIKRAYREVKAVDLGLMYRMLPFVHVKENALCANPNERDPKKIRWFNVKSLASAIGVDEKTLSRRLPHLKFAGEYVIMRHSLGNERKFSFNPHVFYRGNTAPSDGVTALFNANAA
ncbi:hypothetical protein [Paenibacillus odorifer]|uniref:hypothetical protein n=1 Tax=Paenibacillus odorifer TaxID=189426 RepID=UPI00117C0520|nr:hypothetical protein [Paenibacillus odorifer]